MSLGLVGLVIALTSQSQSFDGGFHDAVGSRVSSQLARLIVGGSSGLPADVLPVQVCKDDCVRATLEDATVLSGSLTYRISVTATVRDEVVRSGELSGECPATDLDRCADDAQVQLSAFASLEGPAL